MWRRTWALVLGCEVDADVDAKLDEEEDENEGCVSLGGQERPYGVTPVLDGASADLWQRTSPWTRTTT